MDLDTQVALEGIQRTLRGTQRTLDAATVRSIVDAIRPEIGSLGMEPFAVTYLPSQGAPVEYATDPNYLPDVAALGRMCCAAADLVPAGEVPILRLIKGTAMLNAFSQNRRDWIVFKAEQEHAQLLAELQEDFWFPFFGGREA